MKSPAACITFVAALLAWLFILQSVSGEVQQDQQEPSPPVTVAVGGDFDGRDNNNNNIVVTGKIVSCGGWGVKRNLELLSFLKIDAEVEWYRNLQIEFQRFHRPLLTVYHNGVAVETIDLMPYGTKMELHHVLMQKGMIRKSEDEIAYLVEQRKLAYEEGQRKRRLEQEELRKKAIEARERERLEYAARQAANYAVNDGRNREEL